MERYSYLTPQSRGAEISIKSILEMKALRMKSNLNDIAINQGTPSELIAPDETLPLSVRPEFGLSLRESAGENVYHLEFAGRLQGDYKSNAVVNQAKLLFEEVFRRSFNYIQATADMQHFLRDEKVTQTDPVQAQMKIRKDGTLVAPVFLYDQNSLADSQATAIALPRQFTQKVTAKTKLNQELLTQVFQPDDEELDVTTHYNRAANLYKTNHSWTVSEEHRKAMRNGLWIGHAPMGEVMQKLYFYHVMSNPNIIDREFTVEQRDILVAQFGRLPEEEQKTFLAEMYSTVSNINNNEWKGMEWYDKLKKLPRIKRHVYENMAKLNKKWETTSDPVTESLLHGAFGYSRKKDKDNFGIDEEAEQLAKVGNFSAIIEQFSSDHKQKTKHAPIYPFEETQFSDKVFAALSDDPFYPIRLFPEVAKGNLDIPPLHVRVHAPVRSHMLFSSPKQHVWHASILIGNPLDEKARDITKDDAVLEHLQYVESLKK